MAVVRPKPNRPPMKMRRQLARAARPTIETAAQSEIDPIIAAITKQAQDRAARSEAAISGYTQNYAHQLGGIDAGAPYQGAEEGQAAVDSALRDSLTGGGSDLASQLAARLSALQGSSGASAVGQAAGGLAAQGAGAGGATVALGSAALGNLIGEHAAASSYSTKLPGLAKLSGLQGIKQAEGNAQNEIGQGTTQAEGELPNIVQQIRSARQAAASLKAENAYRGAELQQGQQRIGISAQNAATSRFRAQTSARQGDARIALEQFRAQTTAGHYAVEERQARLNYGLSLEHLALAQQKASQARKSGGLTANEAASMRQKAATDLQSFYHGTAAKYQIGPDGSRVLVDGTGPGSAKTYQESIKSLMLSYPALGPTQIIGMANKLYKPGEGGRPAGKQPNLSLILGPPGGVAPPPFVGGASLAGLRPHEQAQARTLIGLAQDYIGTPYVWGGESPKGFDCSGFAQYLYGKVGVRIPRTTYTQWNAGHAVPGGELQPGDLVFFKGSDSVGGLPGHVGVYVGGGHMIDAPHTGATVRIDNVGSFGGYMGARRYY